LEKTINDAGEGVVLMEAAFFTTGYTEQPFSDCTTGFHRVNLKPEGKRFL